MGSGKLCLQRELRLAVSSEFQRFEGTVTRIELNL